MLIWHADRFFRSGPFAALATFFIPAALAIAVSIPSEVENILGLLLVGALVIFIGSVAASAATAGFGIVLFTFGSYLAEVSPILLSVVGLGLFATLVLHDLAGVFHRAPMISPRIWRISAVTVAAVSGAAIVASALTYVIATAATWRGIVVPFGVAAVGFAIKLAADSHAASARRLTKKRS